MLFIVSSTQLLAIKNSLFRSDFARFFSTLIKSTIRENSTTRFDAYLPLISDIFRDLQGTSKTFGPKVSKKAESF